MADIFIIHGAYGHPGENWIPWLRQELVKSGHTPLAPQFPTPEGQSFTAWQKIAAPILAGFKPGGVLIGHSIGAIFALQLAESAPAPFKAVFPISPFMRDLGQPQFDNLNRSFYDHAFDWPRIRRNAGKITCFTGDDDPYVPLDCAREVADKAGAELVMIAKGGHLNAKAGFTTFPQLLERLKRI